MKLLDVRPAKARAPKSVGSAIPAELTDAGRPVARARCSSSCSTSATSWRSWCWKKSPVPGGADPPGAARGDAAPHDRAGAVRLGARLHRHPAAARRGDVLPAQPGRRAAGRRHQSRRRKTPRKSASPSRDEPFCGLVFKIDADKHGDLYFVRVYSGELKANSRVLNPGKDKKENVAQLWHIQADRREQVPTASRPATSSASSACGTRSPATRCATRSTRSCSRRSSFPRRSSRWRSSPRRSTERKKLADVLEMMKRQDPTFRARENEETGQTLISGMGELHLEVIKHRLLRDFNLNVRVHKPRVSYRETVEHAAEVTGECHRQQAGQTLFAEVQIRIEPLPTRHGAGRGRRCRRATSLPEPYLIDGARRAQRSRRHGGGSLGCPLMKVKITVLGGEVHETDSNEIAFRYRRGRRLQQGPCRRPASVLLEPIMKLEITTPEEHLGDFISDLQQRRAIITHTQPPRQEHGDRRRSPAGQPVRLLQRHARPEPRPGQLLDGAGRLRPGAAGSAGRRLCEDRQRRFEPQRLIAANRPAIDERAGRQCRDGFAGS